MELKSVCDCGQKFKIHVCEFPIVSIVSVIISVSFAWRFSS